MPCWLVAAWYKEGDGASAFSRARPQGLHFRVSMSFSSSLSEPLSAECRVAFLRTACAQLPWGSRREGGKEQKKWSRKSSA